MLITNICLNNYWLNNQIIRSDKNYQLLICYLYKSWYEEDIIFNCLLTEHTFEPLMSTQEFSKMLSGDLGFFHKTDQLALKCI